MYIFQQASGKEAIVTGFYHGGYEESLLMLMKRRGVHSGLVVKVGFYFFFNIFYEFLHISFFLHKLLVVL